MDDDKNFPQKDISYKVIGAAFAVYNELGYGLLEKVYEKALIIELRNSQIEAESQSALKVFYEGEVVGDYFADIVVDGKLPIELKTCQNICDEHVAQTLNYLKATQIEVALIINFDPAKLKYKRLVL